MTTTLKKACAQNHSAPVSSPGSDGGSVTVVSEMGGGGGGMGRGYGGGGGRGDGGGVGGGVVVVVQVSESLGPPPPLWVDTSSSRRA